MAIKDLKDDSAWYSLASVTNWQRRSLTCPIYKIEFGQWNYFLQGGRLDWGGNKDDYCPVSVNIRNQSRDGERLHGLRVMGGGEVNWSPDSNGREEDSKIYITGLDLVEDEFEEVGRLLKNFKPYGNWSISLDLLREGKPEYGASFAVRVIGFRVNVGG